MSDKCEHEWQAGQSIHDVEMQQCSRCHDTRKAPCSHDWLNVSGKDFMACRKCGKLSPRTDGECPHIFAKYNVEERTVRRCARCDKELDDE